jgi:YbbR domain-containing protein
MLDTMQAIPTRQLQLKDVAQNVNQRLALAFDKQQISLQPEEVNLRIAVDRFTEASFSIPIQIPDQLQLKTFPDQVQVNFMVSLSDFSVVEASQFQVELDTSGMALNVNALKLTLTQSPPIARNITMSPESVEHIRIKQ